ncbi:uncharacterized protein LOC131061514 [Cryptomeria japonica]|uniref:uncharacterized protein LOC131061514 n=1 Tax=Cryptomeria japonica TaxID=3369 RepID=UPI0025AC04AE|nr:uncharacterized protein LOC131061514 [Cryptomeria japonica]XP_057851221.1 uncharacterized protein LOC131061514 [Cryptomeria japonica]
MARVAGDQHNEEVSSSGATHGEFLLHLLRKGNNNVNQTKQEPFNDDTRSNASAPSSSLSAAAVEEAWQLTDPAVAALGPSHTFHNHSPNLNPSPILTPNFPLQYPNVRPSSLHAHNNDQSVPLPLAFDQLPRTHYLNPYQFNNHSTFGVGTAPHGHFYGSGSEEHGHLRMPPPPPWIRGGADGRFYPSGHMGGSEGAGIHCGDWQPQKHGTDLRGPSESLKGGSHFPLGGNGELSHNAVLNNNDKCIRGNHCTGNFAQNCVQVNSSAHRLDENQNSIPTNAAGTGHTTLIPSQPWLPVAQEQFIRDGNLQFGSVNWHSEHDKHDSMNGTYPHDKNKFESRSRDIFLHNTELPPNLQGKNGSMRFLCRPSSNQQHCENPTGLEDVTNWDGSKTQITAEPRVSKGSVTYFDKGTLKGKPEVDPMKETTGFAGNKAFYRDHREKEYKGQPFLEIERDSNINNFPDNGYGQLDLIRKDAVRNGTTQSTITKMRYTREPAKMLTQIRTDRQGIEKQFWQSGDGNVPKKCGGNQQEWQAKRSQVDGLMQSGNLDSLSTITDYLSALDVKGSDSCNFSNVLEPRRLGRPDDAAYFSHTLPLHCESVDPVSARVLENGQYQKELGEGAVSEGSQRFAAERRRQGKQRADSTPHISKEAHKDDTGVVFTTNSTHLQSIGDRDKYHNRNNSALSRAHKDPDSNTTQELNMRKQYRRQELMKIRRKEFQHCADLELITSQLLSLYESLKPQEEEETNRKQLLSSLQKLINKQWPGARLHLFGSCANAFGVCKSDIDVCLSIDDEPSSKAELVLKLAEILQAEDMQNVQALTHARVPIVKFTDPATNISCDICINNILAIVNTKLLHDYAQIDVRLQQLAFMVKHWAKCRKINETYQGTLSSYAYVLMCIHFLQLRKPAILPCLQEMEATYQDTIGEIVCAYYDKVNELKHYGAENKETLAQLLSAFFDYWAFRHNYAKSVISVRTGRFLSKNEKDWTRRIGNERHLICIEDPFEISHDLGRVVDKHSIRVLKEEFQRAAEIMLYDPDPCVTLFKPYVPS